MEKFWKALENELFTRGIKTTRGNCVVDNNGKYHIADLGMEGALNTHHLWKHLYIYPSKGIAHSLDVEEIWTGYDREGDSWSDNMGGIRIDCNGLTSTKAITKIVDKIVEHWDEYFV